MLFLQISGKSRCKRVTPVLKGCCITRKPFSMMYFVTFCIIAVFWVISNKAGVGVALVQSDPPSSVGSFSLLFATGTSLSFFTPKNFSKSVLLSQLHRATCLDYFVDEESTLLFWYDDMEQKIFKALLTDTGVGNISVIVSRGVTDLKEIVLDRLSRNVYWIDSRYQRIEVSKLDGSLRTTLLSDVFYPKGLDLDPENGYLFWSSKHGNEYYIERSFLNGDGRKIVVRNLTLDIVFTLDGQRKLIYWSDRAGMLQKTDYDGGNHVVLGSVESLSSVYSLALWNNTVYWTDRNHQTVSRVNAENLNTVEVLTLAYPQLYGMKIFHSKAFPVTTRSKCLFDNGGCSHLCLSGSNQLPSCHCPYGFEISHDNTTCTAHNHFLGYATSDGDVHHFYFVKLHESRKWIYPPLTVRDAKEKSFTVDPVKRYVYWISGSSILRQSAQDNSAVEVIFTFGYFRPEVLALDWMSGNLFVLLSREDEEGGVLSMMSSTGKFFTHLVWRDFYKPGLLAVDSRNKILVWSHSQLISNSSVSYIESFSFDDQVRKKMITVISHDISALFTDSTGKQACWMTDQKRSATCMSYDGEQQTYFRPINLTGISVVPSTNGFLFYVDQKNSLRGINVSSDNVALSVLNAPENASYVAVFNSEEKWTDPCAETRLSSSCSLLCPSLSETRKTCFEKSFLLYVTESSEAHGISLVDDLEPDTFPSTLFHSINNNIVDFVRDNRTRYFFLSDEKRVSSVDQDGKDVKAIVEAELPVTGLAVDWIAGNLYWSVSEKSTIWVSRLTGEHPYIIVNQDTEYPTSLAVHPVLGLLFWKDCFQNCAIKRSTLSGRRGKTIISGVNGMGEINVDVEESLIYWMSGKGLERCDVDGNRRESVGLSSAAAPVSFAVARDFIYWIDSPESEESASVMGITKNSNVVMAVKNISLSSKLLYVSSENRRGKNPCSSDNGGCQHLCLYEGDQKYICQCSYSSLSANKKSCIDERSYILLANRHRIDSIRGDDYGNPNPPKPPIFPHSSIRNIVALYHHRGIIYFSDLHQSPFLFSVRADGSDFRPILEENRVARQIEGIVVEEELQLLLWTDLVTPSIGQYSLKTREEKVLFRLKSSDKPRGIAIASSHRKVFWTNWNDASPKIEAAFLNGSGHRTLLLSTLGRPNGLTVDGNDIYWTDTSALVDLYYISSCGLDGSNSRILYAGNGGHPFDIVSFGKLLFWSDWGIGAVWKAYKLGLPRVQLVLKNLTRPLGLTTVKASEGQVNRDEGPYSSNKNSNPDSDCTVAECHGRFAIGEKIDGGLSFQTELLIIVVFILAVLVFGCAFIVRRVLRQRKRSKNKWLKNRQTYKPRLNSIDSDRLTMDAVIVSSTPEDDRLSLMADST